MEYLLYINGVLENETNNIAQAIEWYDGLRAVLPHTEICVVDRYDGTRIRDSWDDV